MDPKRRIFVLLVSLIAVQGILFGFYYTKHSGILLLSGAIISFLCIVLVTGGLISWQNTDSPGTDRSILDSPVMEPLIFSISTIFFVFWIILALRGNAVPGHEETQRGPIDRYFENIRGSNAALTAFFSQMPKGGDLHNHLTGSIYAESYLEQAIDQKMWIDPKTLKIIPAPKKDAKGYQRMDLISKTKEFAELKQRLFQDWSAKDYFDGSGPPDKHFFDAFAKFPKVAAEIGFSELKNRAKTEHVAYLEVMIGGISVPDNLNSYSHYDTALRQALADKDLSRLESLLNELLDKGKPSVIAAAKVFNEWLEKAHDSIDDPDFTMRYLIAVKREAAPIEVFLGLMGAFQAADQNPLIGGVNIVAREDGELAMRDYRLHMQMFRFLHTHYPMVSYSLHAGELTLGLVRPEDLTWHIREAVYTAGAQRIGHGVDLPYEANSDSLLDVMHKRQIAVEINLLSNQFILKVRDDSHPIMLYAGHKVPIVICTDDAGILRTNLTAQFVALAGRYPQLRYADIKTYIQNSIAYSFIRDPLLKQRIGNNLNDQLSHFEKEVLRSEKTP